MAPNTSPRQCRLSALMFRAREPNCPICGAGSRSAYSSALRAPSIMSEGRRSRNGQQASPTPARTPRREAMSAHSFSYSSRSGSASRSGWKKMRLFSPKRPPGTFLPHTERARSATCAIMCSGCVMGWIAPEDSPSRRAMSTCSRASENRSHSLHARARWARKSPCRRSPVRGSGRWNTPSSCPSGAAFCTLSLCSS